MTTTKRRTMVAITTEETSLGVAIWNSHQIISEVASGDQQVSFENLVAGRRYHIRTWTEDMFGNRSPYRERVVFTPPDNTVPATPTGLTLTGATLGFRASWTGVTDIDLSEYELAFANDDGTGTGPGGNAFTTVKVRTTQTWVDQTSGQKTWAKVRSVDFSGNHSDYSALVSTTPQRITVFTFSGTGVEDAGSPMYCYLKVPASVTAITQVAVTVAFRQFFANATAAASSGTLTSVSGGGSTSGSSSAGSSGASTGHTHSIGTDSLGTLGGSVAHAISLLSATGPTGINVNATGGGAGQIWATAGEQSGHTHGIPHTHSTPAHTHDVNGHTHTLTYGTFEEAMPASHDVTLKTYKLVAGVWTLQNTISGITADLQDEDLTAVITGAGDWRLQVQSSAAQPNNGRMSVDIYGAITAVVT